MADDSSNIEDELLVMDSGDGQGGALDGLLGVGQRRLWRYAFRRTGEAESSGEMKVGGDGQKRVIALGRRLTGVGRSAKIPGSLSFFWSRGD